MNENIKAGADIHAGDGGYSESTQEKYDEFVKIRNDILNQEIVRECLLEIDPMTDDALVERIWELCKGNPWNAAPMYQIMKATGNI